ncbi:MAG: YicC family protein [Acidobacteria bacterium]|nr:MAG: YicC family protein [Acidobacteriota bacterium]
MMSVKSMTGFGTSRDGLSDRFAVGVVVRAVNNRYLDVQVRLSFREEMPEVEAAIRQEVERVAQRGRITVQVDFQRLEPPNSRVLVNRSGLEDLMSQLEGLAVSAGDLLAVPGLINVSAESAVFNEDEVSALRKVVAEAAAAFAEMRGQEGARLAEQINLDLGEIETFLDWFEPQTEGFRQRVFDRLREKVAELLEGRGVDEERLVHEAALLADKADVSEEVVRLRTHLESFSRRITKGGPVGRALDFLCQEIHRELNTLGTKCRELGIADRVVDAKGAVERIREQVQNLE